MVARCVIGLDCVIDSRSAHVVQTFDLFGNRESIVHLNPKISNRALDLPMDKQELDGAQVACSAVNEGGLGASKGVRSEQPSIQADAAYPARD
jgi:hypothetical protein